MKTVLLSIIFLFLGYFCDICRFACQKAAEKSLRKGKSLTQKHIVILSHLTEKSLLKWHKMEDKLTYLLSAEKTF